MSELNRHIENRAADHIPREERPAETPYADVNKVFFREDYDGEKSKEAKGEQPAIDPEREMEKMFADDFSAAKNKQEGCRRENEVKDELEKKYPESEGYQVLRERELCDKEGNPVIDEKTGQKRRVDFVVVKDGKAVDMIEVTSKTADKKKQSEKEERIRDNGGNYVKDSDGNLYRIPDNVKTRVERRD